MKCYIKMIKTRMNGDMHNESQSLWSNMKPNIWIKQFNNKILSKDYNVKINSNTYQMLPLKVVQCQTSPSNISSNQALSIET